MASPVLRDLTVRKVESQQIASAYSPEVLGPAEPQKCCAYNETKLRFLGLDIDAGDFTVASFEDRLSALTPKSGAGIWLLPFRGISASSVHIPVDLLYLDRNGTVLDAVESFPIFQVSPSIPPAASVLVLPSRMIDTTSTRPGDQLILCAPEEMKRRLQRGPGAGSAAPLKEEPIRGGAANVLQWEDRSRPKRPDESRPNAEIPKSNPDQGKTSSDAGTRNDKPAKSWWQRLLTPDPPDLRNNSRERLPGLTAYFWTGGVPVAHDIQDVSPTGLFVVTEERWYPGTVIRMTLTDSSEPTAERSITVNATAVRWGNNGVGLQFVVNDGKSGRRGQPATIDGVDKKQLDQFLQRLRGANG